MGLASDLSYGIGDRNLFHRAIARIALLRPVSWLMYHMLPLVDPFTNKVTKGKSNFSQWMTGIPPVWVTAVGAKSGQPRTVAIYGIPIGDDLGLLGTSLGQPATPAWVYNVEANPDVSVAYNGTTVKARARHANNEERQDVWATAQSIYSGFSYYEERVSHRRVQIFILETAG